MDTLAEDFREGAGNESDYHDVSSDEETREVRDPGRIIARQQVGVRDKARLNRNLPGSSRSTAERKILELEIKLEKVEKLLKKQGKQPEKRPSGPGGPGGGGGGFPGGNPGDGLEEDSLDQDWEPECSLLDCHNPPKDPRSQYPCFLMERKKMSTHSSGNAKCIWSCGDTNSQTKWRRWGSSYHTAKGQTSANGQT